MIGAITVTKRTLVPMASKTWTLWLSDEEIANIAAAAEAEGFKNPRTWARAALNDKATAVTGVDSKTARLRNSLKLIQRKNPSAA